MKQKQKAGSPSCSLAAQSYQHSDSSETCYNMAHVGAWQATEPDLYERDDIRQYDVQYPLLDASTDVGHAATSSSYEQTYLPHNNFSLADHGTLNTSVSNHRSYIPPEASLVNHYWQYPENLPTPNDVQCAPLAAPALHEQVNSQRELTDTAPNTYYTTFDPTAPSLIPYTDGETHAFALYQHVPTSQPSFLPSNSLGGFSSFPQPLVGHTERDFKPSLMPNASVSSSERSWESDSRPPSTIPSEMVQSYGVDLVVQPQVCSPIRAHEMKAELSEASSNGSQNSGPKRTGKDIIDVSSKSKMRPLTAERAPKSRISKRRGKLNPEQRTKAAEMRKAGRCLRCARYKLGCDLGQPCGNCSKVLNSARSFLEPCFRSDLKSVILVRQCNGRFAQTTASFRDYRWEVLNATPTRMKVQWVLPKGVPIQAWTMKVHYKRYIPDSNEIVETTGFHYHVNGRIGFIHLPPCAVSDISELKRAVDKFLVVSQKETEEWIHHRFRNDPIKSATFMEARRYRDKYGSTLIAKAIRMQCGAILSQGSGVVLEPVDRDFRTVDYKQLRGTAYEAYQRHQDRLLPPDRPLPQAVEHQFDVAILEKLNEWQKEFLKDLKTKIFMSGPKPWYEIFLACFVLLANLEYIHGGALAYVESTRFTRLESGVKNAIATQINSWNSGARVLLQHFRCIARAHLAFLNPQLNPDDLREGGFDDETIMYLLDIVSMLEAEGISAKSPFPLISPTTDNPGPCSWSRFLFSEAPPP